MVFKQNPDEVPIDKEHSVPKGDKVPMSAGVSNMPSDEYQVVMMNKLVEDVLSSKRLLMVSADDSVEAVVHLLQHEKQSAVLVVKDHKLLGIISKRDLLLRTAGKETDLASLKAVDIMTPNPEVVHDPDPLAFAVRKMTMGGFRHLPVVSAKGEPTGIISIQDVLSCLAKA